MVSTCSLLLTCKKGHPTLYPLLSKPIITNNTNKISQKNNCLYEYRAGHTLLYFPIPQLCARQEISISLVAFPSFTVKHFLSFSLPPSLPPLGGLLRGSRYFTQVVSIKSWVILSSRSISELNLMKVLCQTVELNR